MASKVCSDWLLKSQIFFAIHQWATHAGMAPENIVIAKGMNDWKSYFWTIVSHLFSIY